MKNKILTFILTFVIAFTVFASTANAQIPYPYISDEAELLTEYELEAINDKLLELSVEHDFDIVVLTIDRYKGNSIEEFADKYYKNTFESSTDGKNGIILVVSMSERDWTMQTFGSGKEIFTDNGLLSIEEEVIPHLSDKEYYKAFTEFASLSSNIIEYYFDNDEAYGTPKFDYLTYALIAVAIGLLLAFATLSSMKAKLKTVAPKRTAELYVKDDSLVITAARDFFLYRTITRIAKPKNNSSGSGSSRSSGSGRSGKF